MPDIRQVAECKQILSINTDSRQIDVIVSADDVIEGRGYRVVQEGMDWEFFKKNPVILWAHDDRGFTGRHGLPVAKGIPETIKIKTMGGKKITMMTLQFLSKGEDEFVDKVFTMMSQGYLNAVSIGFDIHERIMNDDEKIEELTKTEIFEVSIVSIPADKNALVTRSKELNRDVKEAEEAFEVIKNLETMALDESHSVPGNISTEITEEGTTWAKPILSDFTEKTWEDLSFAEKRRIAKHYAWSRTMPPEKFSDLKLPHHRANDGKVVFIALVNIAARINQTDIPSVDMSRVKAHIRAHYKAFNKDIPSSLQAEEDIEKHYQYFLQKQPVNKIAGKIMSKYLKSKGEDVLDNELEAWQLFSDMLDDELSADGTILKQSNNQQYEAHAVIAKPATYNIPISVLKEACNDIQEKCTQAAVEASRRGMSKKQIEGLVGSLGDNLKSFYIKSLTINNYE